MIEPYGKDLTEPLMEYIRLNGDNILASDNRRLVEEIKKLKEDVDFYYKSAKQFREENKNLQEENKKLKQVVDLYLPKFKDKII